MKISDRHALVASAAAAAVAVGGVAAYLLWNCREEEERVRRCVPTRIEMVIATENAGLVIGRHGANIKEIQNKTNTKIHFKDELETDTKRVIEIRGNPDDVQLAEILIHQTILNQPRLETLELRVPYSSTGLLIGRNGENIRGMQNRSRCKIDMDRGPPDQNNMKKMTLKGTGEQINEAKKLIEDVLSRDKNLRNDIQNTVDTRPPRLRYKQPLFLTCDSEEHSPLPTSVFEELTPTSSDNVMEVFVSSILDPGSFYVQKVGPRSVMLDKLVSEMTIYYNQKISSDIHSLNTIEVGDIVATQYGIEGNWYRAKVTKIHEDEYDAENSCVYVDFVDFGDNDKKLKNEIFDLRTDFLKLSFQAIECTLSNVVPANGVGWTEESADDFERLTHCAKWKVILGKITDYKSKESNNKNLMPCLELYDTSATTDINIGNELVKLGHAQLVSSKGSREEISKLSE